MSQSVQFSPNLFFKQVIILGLWPMFLAYLSQRTAFTLLNLSNYSNTLSCCRYTQTWVFLQLNRKIQIQIQIQTVFHKTVPSQNFDKENWKNQIRLSSSPYSCVKIRWCSSSFPNMIIFYFHFQHWNTRPLSTSPPNIINF